MVSAVIDKSRQGSFDEDLVFVERFLGGDTRAFEDLYSKYYEKVFAIARGVLMDSDEASGHAVQEVFTLVYRHLARFDQAWTVSAPGCSASPSAEASKRPGATGIGPEPVALTEAAGARRRGKEPDTSGP